MRPTPSIMAPALWIVLLSSCSSPPKPPTVDESQKRPANSPAAVELQVCKNELQNTRVLATESSRMAERTAAEVANMAARQQLIAAMQSHGGVQAEAQAQANSVYTVRFDFGSTRVAIPPDIAPTLIDAAKASPLVMLRGRTDGTRDTPSESRVARDRAEAVRDYLVAAGVDAARIRTTHQPAGDPVADNGSVGGRGLNRRVEIELYRVLPAALSAAAVAHP